MLSALSVTPSAYFKERYYYFEKNSDSKLSNW
jgi:hypothetical protein